MERAKQQNRANHRIYTVLLLFDSNYGDLGRIQTCNLLSRNQVHYSVMLRGHFCGCKYILFYYNDKIKRKINYFRA